MAKEEFNEKTKKVEEIYVQNGIDISKIKSVSDSDLNVILSIFGKEERDNPNEIIAKVYQPRRGKICEYDVLGECDMDKELLAKWLEDSAERLKILSFLLQKQAKELREIGVIKLTSYYTDPDCNHQLIEK